MLTKNLAKIDKFYYVMTAVLIALSIIAILTFRGIFSAIILANEFSALNANQEFKIDTDKLNSVYNGIFIEKSVGELETGDLTQ